MPTLPASGYAYQQFPTETPGPSPSRYQQIGVGAADFGAARGTAYERLGGALEQAGDRLANVAIQRQQLFNQVAADDQINQVEDRINKLLYGDPAVAGDTGFLGKRGRNALDAFPKIRSDIEDLVSSSRSSLQNEQQRLRFDEASRRFRNFTLSETGRHYDRQFAQFESDTARARLDLNKGAIAVAAAEQRPDVFEARLAQGEADIERALRAAGASDDSIAAARQSFRKGAAKEWAESLALKDAFAAQQFIETNKDVLQDLYPDLSRAVKSKALSQQAMEIVTGVSVKRPSMRINNEEELLDEIARRESSNRNIHQGIADPAKSTNSGYWQISNTNWRRVAPTVGINLAEYPTAISAPPEEQRKVARSMLREPQGLQHWDPYSGPYNVVPKTIAAGDADRLMNEMPPQESGELPDEQVPGLMKRLREMAQRMPADASPELWWASVKLARQMFNMQYTAERQADQLQRREQARKDETISNQVISRLPTDNPPTPNEIMTNPDLSADAKRVLVGFVERQAKPDPMSEVSARNQRELFRRITLPDDDPQQLRNRSEIDRAYIAQDITDVARRQLYDDLQKERDPARQGLNRRRDDMMRFADRVLRPFISNPAYDEATGGPARSMRFKWYMDDKIAEYEKAGKNPVDLFRSDSPDYLGKPEVIDGFKDAGTNPKAGLEDQKKKVDLTTIAGVRAALAAGHFGPPTSTDAVMKARKELIDRGLATESKPELSAPVR